MQKCKVMLLTIFKLYLNVQDRNVQDSDSI